MSYDFKMKRIVLIACLLPLLAANAQEWHTLSGKISLLRGYVDHLRPNVFCYDSNCGEIWKPGGLQIDYELNNGQYELDEDNDLATFVYCDDHVNGQVVELALEVDPLEDRSDKSQDPDKSQHLHISFPNEAIFMADVHSQADIRNMMRMILTFRGEHYQRTKESGGLLCGGIRDEIGNSFGNMQIVLTLLSTNKRWTAKTDEGGHFKFADLPSGNYSLESGAYKDELGCEFVPERWQIKVRPKQRILLYRRIVSVSKRLGCVETWD
jgi:hypothetical protein